MLEFPEMFVKNIEMNNKIEAFINNRLLNLLKEAKEDAAFFSDDDLEENEEYGVADEDLIASIDLYFPANCTKDRMPEIFWGLYALLESEEKFVPLLLQEYFLYQLISATVDNYADLEKSTIEKNDGREAILKELEQDFKEDGFSEIEAKEYAKERLLEIEDLRGYETICFWDTDFALLDQMTEQEIIDTGLNERMGIGAERNNQVFVMPKNWEPKN